MNKLGELLEAERAKRDLTLVAFARDVLGIDHSLVSRYVNGVQSPNRRTARKIAAALGLPPTGIDDLVAASEPPSRLLRPGKGFVISTPTATVQIEDPRLMGHFFGFLSRWERMTEEERESVRADDADFPEPVADRGESGAQGGGAGARDPGVARD